MDLIGIRIYCHNTFVNIIALYIPPASPSTIYESIFEYLEQSVNISELTLISGDFNIPDYKVTNNVVQCRGNVRILREFLTYNSVKQVNQISNAYGHYLDLVLCPQEMEVLVQQHNHPLVNEDRHHPTLLVSIQFPGCECISRFNLTPNNFSYNDKKADLTNLYCTLACKSWTDLYNIENIDAACDFFYNQLKQIIDSFVPKVQSKSS